jgi:hypothetical protein
VFKDINKNISIMFTGIEIGIIELILYFSFCRFLSDLALPLKLIPAVSYYWIMITILTGVWEAAFIFNYYEVSQMSKNFINTSQHVWTTQYDSSYIFPWKLSKIFYAEYGAYADREYMSPMDNWSRIIESSHALFCGLFSLVAIYKKIKEHHRDYDIFINVAMGSQLMNSILYMARYFNTLNERDSVNFNWEGFPAGIALIKRPFMYVNIFWTVMPTYVIFKEINRKIKNE